MTHIIDNIYIGDIFSTNDKDVLKIINCNISMIDNIPKHSHIDYLIIPIDDNESVNIIEPAEKAFTYILKNKNKNILVNCLAGRSRSASVILYYIMKKYNKTFSDAYTFMSSKYNKLSINNGFIKQLKSLS